MLFFALVRFKKSLSKDVIAQNLKDIETDAGCGIEIKGIWWTLGRYETIVLFEAGDEKAAMNLVLKRADRMEIEMLVAVPADAAHPEGPAG